MAIRERLSKAAFKA